MDRVNTYCMGFCFDEQGTRVALIRKKRPKWACGFLNGIGGKIKWLERPEKAMSREFREETGVWIPAMFWKKNIVLHSHKPDRVGTVYVFSTFSHGIDGVRTREDEEVSVEGVYNLHNREVVPNLLWMIPLILEECGFSQSDRFQSLSPHVEK